MANRSKGGLTPGKCVMIGILAVALLVVIAAQFGGKKRNVAAEPSSRRPAAERSEPTSSAAPAPSSVVQRVEKSWPTFDLAAVVASNPFIMPEVLRSGEAAQPLTATPGAGEAEVTVAAIASADVREMRRRQAEFMASLRAQGVDMILRSARGSVARIGDLSLRVGDVHEGLRVEEIGRSGVVFAPTAAEEIQPE